MRPSPIRLGATAAIAHAALTLPCPALAQSDLVHLSLEELGNVTITSAARREQRLADAPASIFVITADDIRRSGATRLPDVLRLAPNLQVSEVYAGGYTITARGFNASTANKLLVLVDGRSVYSPLFAGVFWDAQDVVLEDVERIEVSSGPGSTLWGVNAVNGVINVITRSAADTQGTLASVVGGTRERAAALRHGLTLPGGGALRLYAKRGDLSATKTAAGTPVEDAGHLLQGGFRADWGGTGDRFTLLGNAYQGNHGQPKPGSIVITGVNFALDTIRLSGANLLARWEKALAGGELSVQGYLDRTARATPPFFDDTLSTADLELQYTLRPVQGHTLVLGGELRHSRDRVAHGSPMFAILPERLGQTWSSLFAQDEIALANTLQLTLGIRAERNDYTGTEFLPSLRLAWKPARDHLWWASATHTVRAPSRFDRDVFIPAQPPYLLSGGPGFRSETARVLELGYRGQPLPALTLSATAFRADYDHLRTQELAASRTSLYFGNGMQGRVSGAEAWSIVQAASWLRLHLGLTLLHPHMGLKPGSIDTGGSVATTEGTMPRRQWQLRAALDLPSETELDLMLRHVSDLSAPTVPAYTAVDLRLARRLAAGTEIALLGQNLFDRNHGEFTAVETRTQFRPSLLLQLSMRYR